MEKSNLRVLVTSLKVYFIKSNVLCEFCKTGLHIFHASEFLTYLNVVVRMISLLSVKSVKSMVVFSKPETVVCFKSFCL